MRYRSSVQLHLRGNVFGRLYSDGGVPLSGGQHRHLVQELVDARHQVVTVFGFVRDIVENLSGGRQGEGEITHRSTIARKRARERASKPIHTGCDDVNPGRSTFNLKVKCVIFRYFFIDIRWFDLRWQSSFTVVPRGDSVPSLSWACQSTAMVSEDASIHLNTEQAVSWSKQVQTGFLRSVVE